MKLMKSLCAGCVLLFGLAPCQAREIRRVNKLAVVGSSPFQLRIQTNAKVAPQLQIVSDPERLVIDIPDAMPGVQLHGLRVQSSAVKGVRVSLYAKNPPVTRIVVDLNEPQWYRIAPDASGYVVSLGRDLQAASGGQPTIGWVSAKYSSGRAASLQTAAVRNSRGGFVNNDPQPRVILHFENGMMTIHARNATLSEILYEIQKVTGAEIAIPSGTEQDRVAADFGPGTPSEVMQQLLNGSGLNFVVVGSETDPNALKSVILTRNSGPADSPAAFAQTSVPVPAVEAPEPEQTDAATQQEDDSAPPATPVPGQPPAQIPAPAPPQN
jgi:hypothetical protein